MYLDFTVNISWGRDVPLCILVTESRSTTVATLTELGSTCNGKLCTNRFGTKPVDRCKHSLLRPDTSVLFIKLISRILLVNDVKYKVICNFKFEKGDSQARDILGRSSQNLR
jgi:hypothetical protein